MYSVVGAGLRRGFARAHPERHPTENEVFSLVMRSAFPPTARFARGLLVLASAFAAVGPASAQVAGEDGIPAGRDWERELYHQLRACRAVLILCSPHSMASRWCFAEITHAKAMGKPVLPIKVAECEVDSILAGRQFLDLTADAADGYRRLERALREMLGEGFPWDRERSPYPGLLAFQEEDAALYFGRDDDIRRLIERLNARRAQGGTKLIALLSMGAAGSASIFFAMESTLARLLTAGLMAVGAVVVLSIRTCAECAEDPTGLD